MADHKKEPAYWEALDIYRAMFSEMSDMARSIWFFAADESSILSFEVGPDQTVENAKARHGVKLFAMADALESVNGSAAQEPIIQCLRKLAAEHLVQT